MDRTEKPYLLSISIAKPKPEHKQILEELNRASNGNYTPINFDKHGGLFVFKSKLHPRQIIFDKILFNDDKFLIVEIGEEWAESGHGKAAGWFRTNLENQRGPRI
jgi:hypothetical protein